MKTAYYRSVFLALTALSVVGVALLSVAYVYACGWPWSDALLVAGVVIPANVFLPSLLYLWLNRDK